MNAANRRSAWASKYCFLLAWHFKIGSSIWVQHMIVLVSEDKRQMCSSNLRFGFSNLTGLEMSKTTQTLVKVMRMLMGVIKAISARTNEKIY